MNSSALRLVLFGLPGSGKSALVGSFLQASNTQPNLLQGQIVDHSELMAEFHQNTYKDQPIGTEDEILELPFTLKSTEMNAASQKAVLIDCNGEDALEIIADEKGLTKARPLVNQVFNADTVILVVDASAPASERDENFQKFIEFLKLFQLQRDKRTDVHGLPVYLVLTKCDMLARKNEPNSVWMQRLEEAKRRIDQRFREALAEEMGDLPFGTIDLHLWATSIKRPAAADRPAKTTEPYGVAELLHQCLESAQEFRRTTEHSKNMLRGTILGLLVLVGGMALMASAFFLARPSAAVAELESKILTVLPAEHAPPSQMFREPFDDRLSKLEKYRLADEFKDLPTDLQDRVPRAISQMEQYKELVNKWNDKKTVKDPILANKDSDLLEAQQTLLLFEQNQLGAHLDTWADTELVKRVKQRHIDIELLQKAVKSEADWFAARKKEADALQTKGDDVVPEPKKKEREAWYAEVQKHFNIGQRYQNIDSIGPESKSEITYETVYDFLPVKDQLAEWDAAKEKLREQVKFVKTRNKE